MTRTAVPRDHGDEKAVVSLRPDGLDHRGRETGSRCDGLDERPGSGDVDIRRFRIDDGSPTTHVVGDDDAARSPQSVQRI